MAETWRRVASLADELGCTRPGYDTIRLIVREHRQRRAQVTELLEPVIADLLQGRIGPWDVERVIHAARLEHDRG